MTTPSSSWTLQPERCVARVGDLFDALGDEPWLDLDIGHPRRFAGLHVEITYRASLWDEPARPVFRFWTDAGSHVDRVAAAPVAGAGIWVGRVPRDVKRLSVSPTNRAGLFGFEVERIRRRPWVSLVAEGLRHQRRATRSAILTRLIGWTPESDVNLTWAIASCPLASYDDWRRGRERDVDAEGLDRPRCDWDCGPSIQVVVTGCGDAGALQATLDSLERQIYPHWRAIVVEAGTVPSLSSRAVSCARGAVLDQLAGAADDTLTTVVQAGDRFVPAALAMLVERAHRAPGALLFYGDEVHLSGTGGRTPVFKPGWSRRLMSVLPLGRAAFVRGIASWASAEQLDFLHSGALPSRFLAGLGRDQVVPLRRVVLETPRSIARAARPIAPPVVPAEARAAIIIPTRDHPALLRRAVASIRKHSTAGRYLIVVVDNGSVEEETKALLSELRHQPDIRVLARPGPFNFSAMCNEAAATSLGEVLVFLNDDTEVLSEHWLDRFCALALQDGVGAVGARLTYPDGRLQHIGVLVGMGESAGHFGALAAGDDPGWGDRNNVVNEVSAVTGACLAVARDKFEVVGGFDAVDLPVELSDVDLCLKLNERGWQTLVDPFVHLMHEESVSRGGATLRRLDVYGTQRAVFVERWRHVIRDDPTFHPGLSLYRWQAALG